MTFRGHLSVLVIHSVIKCISLVLRIFRFNTRAGIYCYFFQSFPIHLNPLILLGSAPRENNELFGLISLDGETMVTPRFKRFQRVSHLWKAKSFLYSDISSRMRHTLSQLDRSWMIFTVERLFGENMWI